MGLAVTTDPGRTFAHVTRYSGSLSYAQRIRSFVLACFDGWFEGQLHALLTSGQMAWCGSANISNADPRPELPALHLVGSDASQS